MKQKIIITLCVAAAFALLTACSEHGNKCESCEFKYDEHE